MICGDGYTTFVEIDITQRNVLFKLACIYYLMLCG